ncbi:MAG TPA: hypothetical protein VD905_09905 [Flavobacteriales bacterium]|nr:hypothetical protein [Flavobacteriales bacterium]
MRKIYPIVFCAIVLNACKKWDKAEQVPSYIYIDHIDLSVNATQGTASHGIIDAWVYVNDQAVGVFNLPATVPILASGNQKITIAAGIKEDGLTEHRAKYPLFQQFVKNIDLVPGQIYNMTGADQPVVTYYPSTEVGIWYENFDDAAIDFNTDPNSEAGITYVYDTVNSFEGPGMGKIELGSGFSYARVITAQTFILPKLGNPVFVELNYNTNNTMAIGIQAINGTQFTTLDNTVLNPTNGEWKKIYVKLTEIVSEQSTADSFKFIITVDKDSGVDVVQNYIDNFKVVYDK